MPEDYRQQSIIVLFRVLVALAVSTAGAAAKAENAAQSEARLRQSVTYLASDELEGRGVGTEGLNKAADFLDGQFADAGLRTDLFQGSPFQEFEITVASELGPASQNRLTLLGPAAGDGPVKRISLKLNETFTPLAIGGTGKFEAPLVFVGYGITAKNLKRGEEPLVYDDYAQIDVRDKVVIIVRKEPQQKDAASPFDGARFSEHASFDRKVTNANEHGAAAVIFVNDAVEVAKQREALPQALQDSLGKLAELRDKLSKTSPADESYAKLAEEAADEAKQAAESGRGVAAQGDVLLDFAGAGPSSRRNLPVYFCTRTTIDEVLQAAGRPDLTTVERQIDGDLVPRSCELPGWRAQGETNLVESKAKVKNVIAVLDGSGPQANETIVIGAHYDHLGYGGAGSLAPWTAEIHNGADDNASGTAVLLEIARRLATAAEKPNRRLVFIAFTGEERGLLGSAFYTRQPRFPLENTVAMFNLDMVGRLRDDNLAIYGTGTAKEFDPLVQRLAHEYGFKLSKHAGGFGPSDHNSFYAKKIPVLHLFTGNHSDYHRPSDDSDKLNITGMRRIADFMVDVVRATDAGHERPTYVEIRRVEQLADAPEGDRPSFGSMPAYPNPAPDGVLLEAVMEGTPADKAGIKGGDVLTKFGDSKITVLEDFESALRKHKPGDKVKVVVRRGKEMIEAEVTLARRRAMP
jgi:hypothetical protein